jgi:O-antigen/teichoic acid export membrane protein
MLNDKTDQKVCFDTSKSEVVSAAVSDIELQSDTRYAHINTKRAAAAMRGTFWSAINAIVPTLLNSLVFVVTSRYLLPHDFGMVALAVSVVSFASAIAPAALGDALVQRFNIRKHHLDTVFWFCISSALLIYIVLVLLSPTIAMEIGHADIAKFLPIIGLKLFFDLSAAVPNALIARSMSFHLIAVRTIVATVVSSVLCIGMLLNGYGIWSLVISQLSVSITGCVAVFFGTKWLPGFEISAKALRDLGQYGVFASGNRFLQTMNLDQLIIGSLIGTAPLGIYNFSRRLFQMLNDVIAGALNSVSMALFSSLQNEQQKVKQAFLVATFASSIISFPAFIGLASIAGEAIPIVFGAHWSAAIWPTRWFCLIGLMSCIGVVQSSLINSQGKSNWWFYYQLFRQVLTISTIVFLYDKGVSVIVLVIAVQTLLCWPITLVMVRKIINLKISSYFRQFMEPMLASVLMFVTIILVRGFLEENSPALRLVAEIAMGAMIYALTIFAMARQKILKLAKTFLNRQKH